jgi:uncharacterized protein YydD (DUF2326 family)
MKLSKLYSNLPDKYSAVKFQRGLNTVLAEIRLPKNRDKDTHNLGKTTLGRMLDFALLSGKDGRFFLFKHSEIFVDFVFYLELELLDGSYVTLRRSVAEASRIAFKKHAAGNENYSNLPDANWDHSDVPFERAKELLNSFLGLNLPKPWDYRKGLGYLLRSQDDFRDVFQLKRFAGPHADWKPYLAHVLGFDANLVAQHYEKERSLSGKEATAKAVTQEMGGSAEDASKIDGMLLLKRQEIEKRQRLLDAFDFRAADRDSTKEIVEKVDARIAELNGRRYSLNHNRRKIDTSLEQNQILFNPEDAKKLFDEAGVLFAGQVKKDFEQLIAFNRAITDERRTYLQEERTEIETELKAIGAELNSLGKRRSETLSFLSDSDTFQKYKQASAELVTLRADVAALERQRNYLHRLQELRAEIRNLTEQKNHIQTQIEANVQKQNAENNSKFSQIRIFFNEFVEEVLQRKALLSVSVNTEGHLDFKAEILDEAGNATSADMGHTYRKLLCIAFDMSILRAHLDERFPRFAYHDGAFESLDDRKKETLLTMLRRYADLGLQPIITLIDSDLPARKKGEPPVFEQAEIVLLLHDEGEEGRLFKMPSW